ncbi:MAG TPA: hypothetical protein VLM42_14960, partial [Bryobacteraceae bacterium]|nr:hypothetical protein [Bryobacteraceae bacterium]
MKQPDSGISRLRVDAAGWQRYQAALLLCRVGLAEVFPAAWFRKAVSLSLGDLVLLDAGLYSPAPTRQP